MPLKPGTELHIQYGTEVRRSEKAILWELEDGVEDNEGKNRCWIPFSQTSEIHPDRIVISVWVAKQKGLI